MKTMTRRVAAGFAATTLTLGLAACSSDDAKQAQDSAGSVAAEATSAVGDAATAAKDKADEAMGSTANSAENSAENTSGANAEAGETVTIATAAGEAEVPAAFATAIEDQAAQWGIDPQAIMDIHTTDAGSLAVLAEDKLVAFDNESAHSVPVIGKIAQTYLNEGGLDSGLGLPLSPEQVLDQGTGWIQEFAGGSISWLQDAAGEFGPEIEKN
ncbi:hypothetical protein G7Y31_04095 [Corynebacterium lizhenjunii]|uniref:Uncharacterized protein n=2 Tax=Corynebacterium lizhenjunii TaxID=2709394 RepID=A0A7T0KGT2_9CORY|nr:hypothetical protein G7Y31_04095 [Corynebacterium lizhenjunii]